MSSEPKTIDELPIDSIENRLLRLKSDIADEFSINPQTINLETFYINGSFGGGAATESSDLDITVGVLNNSAVSDIHLDQWIAFSRKLSGQLSSVDGHTIDIQVFPTEKAAEHVKDRCSHGRYDTVYDIGSREHIPVTEVW